MRTLYCSSPFHGKVVMYSSFDILGDTSSNREAAKEITEYFNTDANGVLSEMYSVVCDVTDTLDYMDSSCCIYRDRVFYSNE